MFLSHPPSPQASSPAHGPVQYPGNTVLTAQRLLRTPYAPAAAPRRLSPWCRVGRSMERGTWAKPSSSRSWPLPGAPAPPGGLSMRCGTRVHLGYEGALFGWVSPSYSVHTRQEPCCPPYGRYMFTRRGVQSCHLSIGPRVASQRGPPWPSPLRRSPRAEYIEERPAHYRPLGEGARQRGSETGVVIPVPTVCSCVCCSLLFGRVLLLRLPSPFSCFNLSIFPLPFVRGARSSEPLLLALFI